MPTTLMTLCCIQDTTSATAVQTNIGILSPLHVSLKSACSSHRMDLKGPLCFCLQDTIPFCHLELEPQLLPSHGCVTIEATLHHASTPLTSRDQHARASGMLFLEYQLGLLEHGLQVLSKAGLNPRLRALKVISRRGFDNCTLCISAWIWWGTSARIA